MKKIALFIDQANLWGSYKRVGSLIDFKLLLEYLEKTFDGKVIVKNIYFAYPWDWTRDYDVKWIHRFWVFLKKELWFRVVKKELKRIEVRDEKNNIVLDKDWKVIYKEKWNLDVELVMDVMKTQDMFDEMVLFSWDSDFQPLVSYLLFKWKKVYVFSTPWNASSELVHWSSKYFDITKIAWIYRDKLHFKNEKP